MHGADVGSGGAAVFAAGRAGGRRAAGGGRRRLWEERLSSGAVFRFGVNLRVNLRRSCSSTPPESSVMSSSVDCVWKVHRFFRSGSTFSASRLYTKQSLPRDPRARPCEAAMHISGWALFDAIHAGGHRTSTVLPSIRAYTTLRLQLSSQLHLTKTRGLSSSKL